MSRSFIARMVIKVVHFFLWNYIFFLSFCIIFADNLFQWPRIVCLYRFTIINDASFEMKKIGLMLGINVTSEIIYNMISCYNYGLYRMCMCVAKAFAIITDRSSVSKLFVTCFSSLDPIRFAEYDKYTLSWLV